MNLPSTSSEPSSLVTIFAASGSAGFVASVAAGAGFAASAGASELGRGIPAPGSPGATGAFETGLPSTAGFGAAAGPGISAGAAVWIAPTDGAGGVATGG